MAGDYTKFQRHYGPISISFPVTGLISSTTTLFTVRNSSYRIYIQKASFKPTIYGTQTTINIQDSTGFIVATFLIPSVEPSVGAGGNSDDWLDDYGPTGTPLTMGANLQAVVTPVSMSGIIYIEAYQRLAQTIGSNDGAAKQ